jgi:Ca-activated chloride channel family protein
MPEPTSPGLQGAGGPGFSRASACRANVNRGVGNDYNENLMAKIALHDGGLYYFIYSPEKLPAIFNEELKGMSKVIAKNTILKIKFPSEYLTYDRTFNFSSNLKGDVLEISFNDLFAEEQKSILICFKTKGKLNSPLNIECSVDYSNANVDPILAFSDIRKSEMKPAVDDKEYDTGYNHAASEGYALGITQELYDNAVENANAEHYPEAKAKVARFHPGQHHLPHEQLEAHYLDSHHFWSCC